MKKINIILIIICIGTIVAVGYFTIGRKIIESKNLCEIGKPVSAYKGKLEVIKTYVGGTKVFPTFYMNVKNNSDKEVIYIKALFRVYDWETDRLKAAGKLVLLDHQRDRLTIKPGKIKTLKTNLFDLRYKKDDIIRYKFIDIKTRKYVK